MAATTWTCKYPEGEPNANTVPDTRIANVPANDDTIHAIYRPNTFPEISLSWLGDDPDGYVIAYRYRWVDGLPGRPFPPGGAFATLLNIPNKPRWENVILVKSIGSSLFNIYNYLATLSAEDPVLPLVGDSLATLRTFAVPYRTGPIRGDSIAGASRLVLQTTTSGTFIFDSPADSNIHRFDVKSVDNTQAEDPTPASVHFWTLVSPGSVAVIDEGPIPNSYAIRYPTERWPGLRFVYRSMDPNNSFGIDFSHAVDDSTIWSDWTESNVAYITARDFKPVRSGQHRFFIRARNRWGVISPVVARDFTAIIPKIDDPLNVPRMLILNNDINGNGSRGRPTVAQVEAEYRAVLDSLGRTGAFDVWTTSANGGRFPLRDSLGKYTCVLLLSEQKISPIGPGSNQVILTGKQDSLRQYLYIGGKLIYSGSPDIRSTINPFEPFASEILHRIEVSPQTPFIQNTQLDWGGATGRLGYPDVRLDTLKLNPDSNYSIRNIALNFPRTFARSISAFDSKSNNLLFEGAPLGIRYLSSIPRTYHVVYLGFPLYYAERSVMVQTLRQALIDISE